MKKRWHVILITTDNGLIDQASSFEFPISSSEIRSLHYTALRSPDEFHQCPDVVGFEA
jgi:hypothetical protein